MKKIILSAIAIALLATSCKKSTSNEPDASGVTVLLTSVTNNTQGDIDYGKKIADFSYQGKQLKQATIYSYSGGSNKEIHTFSYNQQGQLTGSVITHTTSNSYDYISAAVTYSNNNIGKISFFKAGNIVAAENTLTYMDNKLTRWFNPNNVDIIYSYNESGNNIKQVATEYSNNKVTGYVYTDQYATFDTKHNLTSALPNWIYFRVCNQEEAIGYIPGIGNPLTGKSDNSNVTYSYDYNTYGYPASVNIKSGSSTTSFTYTYTVVN